MQKTNNKVQMNGFVIIDNDTGEIVYFGSRRDCRSYRAEQEDNIRYSGAQRVTGWVKLDN